MSSHLDGQYIDPTCPSPRLVNWCTCVAITLLFIILLTVSLNHEHENFENMRIAPSERIRIRHFLNISSMGGIKNSFTLIKFYCLFFFTILIFINHNVILLMRFTILTIYSMPCKIVAYKSQTSNLKLCNFTILT